MNPWLYSYHPAAPLLVLAVMGISGAAAALVISFFLKRFPRYGFLVAASAWIAMEYLRNSGFAAFPYGILGSSQYLNPGLLQSASAWGVWGLSFVLAALSAFLAQFLSSLGEPGGRERASLILRLRPLACVLILLAVSHSLGFLFPAGKTSSQKVITLLAVQPNNEPRRSGAFPASSYAERLQTLIKQGLSNHPECDLIVSSETAFPPAIELRMESSGDTDDDRAVRSFMRELASYGKPVLLGNDRGRFGLTPDGRRDRLHYNASLLIDSGRVEAAYEKNRLVPFIEYFPFYRTFPSIYRFLEKENGVLWTPGSRISVFKVGGLGIGTPICYEDCFGDICREFARSGADILVPMASDAWSGSLVAMRQHLSNAVFRAVETRRPLLRVSNNGLTCLITPDGRIRSILPAFTRQTALYRLSVSAPPPTPYFLWGDWLPIASLLFLVILAAPEVIRSPSLTRRHSYRTMN